MVFTLLLSIDRLMRLDQHLVARCKYIQESLALSGAVELMFAQFCTWRCLCYTLQRHNQGVRSTLGNGGETAQNRHVACMRKLLTFMNSMLKINTPWNPKKA